MKKQSDYITLDKLGSELRIPLIFSLKAKNISIKIDHEGPKLILPNKNYKLGYKFLLSKEHWIRKKLQLLPKIDDKIIPIFGKKYLLNHVESNFYSVQIKDEIIEIHSSQLDKIDVLVNFLQHKLLLEATKLVEIFSKANKLHYKNIKIMDNKSKWGCYSNKGVLSFNWRLIFAPKEILEYLVVHELCHITEMNHSIYFWQLVEKFYPNYKMAELWLKKNGLSLYLYLQNS